MNLKNLKLKQNSKIKLKCFFTLILVFTIVISSIPNINVFANESYEYKCISEDTLGYCLKQTLKDVQPNTQNPTNNVMPMLFNVKHRDDDISKAYCLDVNTPVNGDTDYSISNIEDADYYSDENAKKIRAILKNSYPYVGLDKLVSNLREKTNDPNFNLKLEEYTGSKEDAEYKNAYDIARVAVAATQLAIWKYSNGFSYEGLQTGRYSQDIIENVENLYYKLLELAELGGEDAEVPVAKILSKEPIIVSHNGDTVDIEFRFKIHGDNVDGKMNYTIENKPVDSKIIEYYELDEDGYKRVKITNIPSGIDIKFVISGTQYINKDVFLYKPEGGRDISQTLIGECSGSINISKTFDYKCVFGEVKVTKVDSENKTIPLEGAEFTIKNYSGFEKVINTGEDGTASTKLLPGEYTIEETKAPDGYKISNRRETFTISDTTEKTITFEYSNEKLNPISQMIEATKVLQGKDLKADMFSFELLDYQGKVLETVKNGADGKIQFTPRTYKKVGTYTYKIREVDGSLDETISNGITYDKNIYEVKVKVTDDGSGNLVSNVVYPNGKITFTNKYEVKETSEVIEATKILQGKDLKAEEFSFELLDYQGKVLETVKNSADGKIQFTPRTYKKVGTYTYKIREVDEILDGITYDKNIYDVKVKVRDDGSGNLVSNVVYPNGKITFTNKYEVKETNVNLEATKILQGKDLKADMFSFKLLDLNKDGEGVEIVKNDSEGKIKFKTLRFNSEGTYHYQIVEVNEGLEGITYDSQPIDIIIKVTDNNKGNLSAEVSYPVKENAEFKNIYKAGSTSATIKATKILEGKDLEAGVFSFELLDEQDNILQTVKNSRNGKVHFKAITYDKAGTYKYTVKEVKGTLNGIDYDESEYEVTVKVTDDGKGNLVSEVIYPEGGVVFNNTYKVGITSAIIEGTKKLTGKDLKEDMFSFELLDEDNNVLQTVKNSVDGKVQFAAITYDKVGTYKYKVREVKDTLSGIDYDESEYEVTVKVTDDGEGNLVSEVIYPEGGVLFENIVVEGSVKLIKVDKDDNEKRIEGAKFVLLAEDKETVIAENLFTDSEGKIIVSNLQPGTYYFKEIEAAPGYVLNDTLIKVEVESNQQSISTAIFENEKEKKEEVINPDTEPDNNPDTEPDNNIDTNSNNNSNNNTNTNSSNNSNNNTNTYYPKTSDTSIIGYTIGGVVAVGALVGINRRRKNK